MKLVATLTLLLLALAPYSQAVQLKQADQSSDRSFLLSVWNALESDLVRLEGLAKDDSMPTPSRSMAGIQIEAKPEAKHEAKATSSHSGKAKEQSLDLGKLMKGALGASSKGPMNSAALVPALGMLKAMYEDGKDRITKLNAREQKLKKQFEERQKDHKDRVDKIESKHHEHHLSDEFYKNETRDETRMFSYWERVRERQHRQYHTSLKIQHSMMSRVKQMVDMYEKTINGKDADKAKVKKELQQVAGGMPEVVLLQQTRKEVVEFCQGALLEAQQARKELESSPDEPEPRLY